MLRKAALRRGVQFGTNCRLIANHSGIFCTAITIITNNPSACEAH